MSDEPRTSQEHALPENPADAPITRQPVEPPVTAPAPAPARRQGRFGRALRSAALWLLVVLLAGSAGFGAGYVLQERDKHELRQLIAEQRATLTEQMASLERRIHDAEQRELEQELARTRLTSQLTRTFGSLAAAVADVEAYGSAQDRIAEAQETLDTEALSPMARDRLRSALQNIDASLGMLDRRVREKIREDVDGLEQALAELRDEAEPEPALASAEAQPGGETEPAATAVPAATAAPTTGADATTPSEEAAPAEAAAEAPVTGAPEPAPPSAGPSDPAQRVTEQGTPSSGESSTTSPVAQTTPDSVGSDDATEDVPGDAEPPMADAPGQTPGR